MGNKAASRMHLDFEVVGKQCVILIVELDFGTT